MTNAAWGLLILILAGVMNASFALPMKYTRRWAWENTWLIWSLMALILLPVVITCTTVSHLGEIYHSVATDILLEVIGFGFGWGTAQVLFGLAVDAIGIALTFSLVLGTSAAVGALVPLIRLHPERLNTLTGHYMLAGVALMIAGVLVCAVAGSRREKTMRMRGGPQKRTTLGLALAILCGLGAAFVNFGLAFGAPLVDAAQAFGTNELNASNAVWLPLMLAGAVPNILYCLWLLRKNGTGNRFDHGGAGHWGLAFAMAICWFGSTVLYGLSASKLGAWGAVLGWPLFMSLIVITACVLGMVTGEWLGASSNAMGRSRSVGLGRLHSGKHQHRILVTSCSVSQVNSCLVYQPI
jgi:L-rhamnose-H+ transport protein